MEEPEGSRKRRFKRALQAALSLAVIIGIFGFAFPKLADYSAVWAAMRAMSWIELSALLAVSILNIATYWLVMVAALPGSTVGQAMKVNQTSTAVANTLPGGGGIGIAVTYGMYSGYGFSRSDITLSVVVSGVWNNFVKLGMPIIALLVLALQGDASGSLVLAGLVGVLVLAISVGLFALVFKSEELARKVGRGLGRFVSFFTRRVKRPTVNLAQSVVDFRRDAIGLLARRWLALTVTAVASHLSLFLVLLLSLRNVGVSGEEVGWAQVLAAFAFIRLISALPITPGGVGLVELGLTAALISAGGAEVEVAAGVLVFRALTYLLPIPIGVALYLEWRRGSKGRKKRRAAQEPLEARR